MTPNQLAVRRMRPFARSLRPPAHARGLAVWSLQYRFRAGTAPTAPVADATWALEQVTERYGDVPVVLVGHSMGGRTAVHVAGHSRVVAIAAPRALAPTRRADRLGHGPRARGTGARHHDQSAALPRLGAKSRPSPTRVVGGDWRRNATPCCGAALWHRMATEFTPRPSGSEPRRSPPRPATTGSTSSLTTTNRRREVASTRPSGELIVYRRPGRPPGVPCSSLRCPSSRASGGEPMAIEAGRRSRGARDRAPYRDRHRRDPDDRVRHVRRRLRLLESHASVHQLVTQALDERLGRTRPS